MTFAFTDFKVKLSNQPSKFQMSNLTDYWISIGLFCITTKTCIVMNIVTVRIFNSTLEGEHNPQL